MLGKSTDAETYLMVDILKNLLIDFPSAPLKKSLIDNGIGEDVIFFKNEGIQLSISFVAKHINADQVLEFEKIVFSTLKKLVENGIDKELIESCINVVEYDLRETERFPVKGVAYSMKSMDSWLYDSNPITHLQYNKTLSKLKSKINTGYFERFIEDSIINNNHQSIVILSPKKGANKEEKLKLEKKLNEYKYSLSNEEIDLLIKENIALSEKQLQADSIESLATIPKLSISDVDPKAEVIPQEITIENGITFLFHEIFSNSISYVDFLFDAKIIDQELIPYIALLVDIIGNVDTNAHTYSELSRQTYLNTGGIDLSTAVYVENGNDNVYHPKIVVSGKAIGDKVITLLKLIRELTTLSKFDDKKRIKELLLQIKSKLELNIYQCGSSVVSKRVSSYFSPPFKYSENIDGLDYFWFVNGIIETYDNICDEILDKLKNVYDSIFNINKLIISFTGEKGDYDLFVKNYNIVLSALNNNNIEAKQYHFMNKEVNEGILSTSQVQYIAKGFNFNHFDYHYSGSMNVLEKILSDEYLHDRIRAKGGAYSVGIRFARSGNILAVSNLNETLNVFDSIAQYINDLDINQERLNMFIIGAISDFDKATTPYMKGELATGNYLCNISQLDIQHEREEILNTTLNDIKSLADMIYRIMQRNYYCVLGNDNTIKENKGLFNNLVQLIN